MIIREVLEAEKKQFNAVAVHPLQSWEWGDFRKKTGNQVVRLGAFDGRKLINAYQLTVHPIPKSKMSIMVMTRGPVPDEQMVEALQKYARENNIVFVKVEPNLSKAAGEEKSAEFDQLAKLMAENGGVPAKPQFAKYTYVLDLAHSEEELLEKMHSKTRYNVRLAQKHGVTVQEDDSDQTWEAYWKLTEATTLRQQFYSHDRKYHQSLWESLKTTGMIHLMKATYEGKILSTWILFLFGDTLYYPYGAWSGENREVMANNLMMWEAIRFGKNNGAKIFDMWGAAGPDTPKDDPWWGFTNFKEGYGGQLMEFAGSYDLVVNPPIYSIYKIADKWRWKLLRMAKKIPVRFA